MSTAVHPFHCVYGSGSLLCFLKPSCHFPIISEIYNCREGWETTEIFLKHILSQHSFFFSKKKNLYPPVNSKNLGAVYAGVGACTHAPSATHGISPSRSSLHPGPLSGLERVSMLLQWFRFCLGIIHVLRIALSSVSGVWGQGLNSFWDRAPQCSPQWVWNSEICLLESHHAWLVPSFFVLVICFLVTVSVFVLTTSHLPFGVLVF